MPDLEFKLSPEDYKNYQKEVENLVKHNYRIQYEKMQHEQDIVNKERHDLERSKAVDTSVQNNMAKNQRGEMVSRDEVMMEAAEESLSAKGQTTYQDAKYFISSMVADYYLLVKALHYSMRQLSPEEQSTLPGAAIFRELKHQFLRGLESSVRDLRILTNFPPEVVLPMLRHLVEFDDGKVHVAEFALDPSDKINNQIRQNSMDASMASRNQSHMRMVSIWLKGWGVDAEFHPATNKFDCTKDGIPLSAEQFNEMKHDPVNGLSKMLERHCAGLEFSEQNAPENAPRP
ncbi:MAG: hypothetical protein H0U75_02630 [Legionella sp.]|nr:hypothetical protein [Legionella sp.]